MIGTIFTKLMVKTSSTTTMILKKGFWLLQRIQSLSGQQKEKTSMSLNTSHHFLIMTKMVFMILFLEIIQSFKMNVGVSLSKMEKINPKINLIRCCSSSIMIKATFTQKVRQSLLVWNFKQQLLHIKQMMKSII
ncbi:MAG: Uncharacterised protein [Bacteroidetes bacterium MED-G17]|nr:MAG: Uncharacterised protein [Bacteroidetes bacterium MED-G17]